MPTTVAERPAAGRFTTELTPDRQKWLRQIARGVRRRYRFDGRSADAEDLESVALVTYLENAHKFDPEAVGSGEAEDRFRGWLYQYVRSECVREARRLRNGGTYNTRREKRGEALVAGRLDPDGGAVIEELSEKEWNRLEAGPEYPPDPDERKKGKAYPRQCPCGKTFTGANDRRCCSPECRAKWGDD